MAGEGANLAAEAARAALELSMSASTSGFSVSLKIDNTILAGVTVLAIGAGTLTAYYLAHRRPAENAIINGLEETNETGEADPQVRSIETGSVIVELYCRTEHSLLQFVEDFEAKRVKHRLEEEFTKIGFDQDLDVTIINVEEVYKKVHEIRLSQEISHAAKVGETRTQKLGAVMELHEITVIIAPNNAEKEEKFNQHFKPAVSMFMNNDKSSSHGELGDLIEWIEDTHNVHITAVGFGSLEILVECPTLDSLESLKRDHFSGRLNYMAERCLLTDEVREKLDLKDVTLKTVIKQEDYLACRKFFLESSENIVSYNTVPFKITS